MHCKNCGKKLREKEKFCTICGYYNDHNEEDIEKEEVETEDEIVYVTDEDIESLEKTPKKEIKGLSTFIGDELDESLYQEGESRIKREEFFNEDERYLEAFIGEDYKLIKNSPFNIYAFLLNWMYVLYRKMYLIGIIGMLLTGVIIILSPKFLLVYIVIVMAIIGLLFNKVYLLFAQKKIEKILIKYEGTDKFTMEGICKSSGGVNTQKALGIYFIFLLIIFSSMFIHYNKYYNQKFWDTNTMNKANCTSLLKTAYKNLEEDASDKLVEGACNVITNNKQKEYNIYLKLTGENNNIFLYYQTENDHLIYKDDTDNLEDLEKSTPLTEDIKKMITDKKLIEERYTKIKKESLVEDNLIKNKKNTSEKKNYILKKDEIIR